MSKILNALMVKRLRRRPLTAESGVRFPMGVPKKSYTIVWDFYLFLLASFTWGIAHFVCVALPHEPQNTGLAFHSASKLARFTITLTLFSTIPHGGTKKSCTIVWDFYLFLLASFTRCLSLCIGYSSIYHKKIGGAGGLLRFVFGKWCLLKTCGCRVDTDCLRFCLPVRNAIMRPDIANMDPPFL